MTQQLDLTALKPADRYKLLTAIVLPRPVAWVTTMGHNGIVNAAPYSFFNLFGKDPALVVLGLEHRDDGSPKDTTRNIRETGNFVVNILTPELVPDMVATAAAYRSDQSEPKELGLKLSPSVQVGAPRLTAAPAAIECRLLDIRTYSSERDLIVGEAVSLTTQDGMINETNYHVDWHGEYPVARLFADRYARLEEIEPLTIPTLTEEKQR